MSNNSKNIYVSIDLKSFYASVECIERGLDPMTTNLVVADAKRTEKTICLAVSPALKSYGIPGRARLFEVVQKVKQVNIERKIKAPNHILNGKSYNDIEIKRNCSLELDYIAAPPRMSLYMKYSTDIYNIYLKFFSSEDIYVYSVDEVFIDITKYLKTYNMTTRNLVTKVIHEVYNKTGITATAGIGTNLYLCKVAMDIVAKHVKADKNGVRIAGLDEITYRKLLWCHEPITDFWRVGKGYSKKLAENKIYTMGDIALASIENEELFYKLFGINAELLIDHAWGYEPCTINDIKSYKPISNSISSGQVLHCPYNYENTKLIIKEMTELFTLELVEKNFVTNQIVLTVGYDIENLTNPIISKNYKGEIVLDRHGRRIPKHAHGTINLEKYTSSTKIIMEAVTKLYDRIINKELLTRRINITANKIINRTERLENNLENFEQISLFEDYSKQNKIKEEKLKREEEERSLQLAVLNIKKKYGKNSILKGMNLENGGTTIERNGQIGGHKS